MHFIMKRKAEPRDDDKSECKRVRVENVFPLEIWMLILEKLKWRQLLIVARVCTRMRQMAMNLLRQQGDKVAQEILRDFSLSAIPHVSVYREWHKVLQWTKEDVQRDGHSSVFALQEEEGNLEVCQWLQETFQLNSNPTKYHKNALSRALHRGHYDVCVWHCITFGILKEHLWEYSCRLYENALQGANVHTLTWLHQYYDICKKDILDTTNDNDFVLGESILQTILCSFSISGSLKGCKWLWTTFQLSANDVSREDRVEYLEKALLLGNIKYCDWLYQVCEMKSTDLLFRKSGQSSSLLQKSVQGEHLSSCIWMYEKTQFDASLVRYRCLLHHAVQKGNAAVCTWLVKTFHLTQKDGLAALRKMSEGGCWEGYMWLCSVFSFPTRKIAQIALHTRNAGHYCLAKNLLDYFQLTEPNGYSYE